MTMTRDEALVWRERRALRWAMKWRYVARLNRARARERIAEWNALLALIARWRTVMEEGGVGGSEFCDLFYEVAALGGETGRAAAPSASPQRNEESER